MSFLDYKGYAVILIFAFILLGKLMQKVIFHQQMMLILKRVWLNNLYGKTDLYPSSLFLLESATRLFQFVLLSRGQGCSTDLFGNRRHLQLHRNWHKITTHIIRSPK